MRFLGKVFAAFAGAVLALMLTIGVANAASDSATVDATTVPVTGTLVDTTGAVAGTLQVQQFTADNGALTAIGTFTGTVTDATGHTAGGTQQISVPVDLAQSTGSCQLLDLVLGPLDLDLLGLQVHLDTVHLNITAQAGPGDLLGNLLCSVAGLLDGPGPLNAVLGQIAVVLNQLLGLLA